MPTDSPRGSSGFRIVVLLAVLANLILVVALITGALALRYFYVTHQWRHTVVLEARARIRALQARIRPHFLFNSMNTIAALTRSDPGQAEEAIERMQDDHVQPDKLDLETRRMLTEAGRQIPEWWRTDRFSRERKKALLRCLIDKVVVHRIAPDREAVVRCGSWGACDGHRGRGSLSAVLLRRAQSPSCTVGRSCCATRGESRSA